MSRIEPPDPEFDPAEWKEGDEETHLARGVELFNAGRYEAAHEEFERLWLSTQGPDSDFYKGLVQAAIALHHFQRGNAEGAAGLYATHRRYLAPYLPAHRAIDLRRLLEEMKDYLGPALRGGAASSDRDPPRLRPA